MLIICVKCAFSCYLNEILKYRYQIKTANKSKKLQNLANIEEITYSRFTVEKISLKLISKRQ